MAESENIIVIDGATLEGGGQVLRNCVSFAALLNRPVRVENVRGGRRKPGLRNQHLLGIQFVSKLFKGQLTGGKVQSMEISYSPTGELDCSRDEYNLSSSTASSVCLLMQIAFPVTLFSDRSLTITLGGGTNASFAPQIDYTILVFKPVVENLFGIDFDISVDRRGYFPKGGGVVTWRMNPKDRIPAFELTQFGNVTRIYVRSMSAKLPDHIAERQANACVKHLRKFFKNIEIEVDLDRARNSLSVGTGIVATIETDTGVVLGGSGLGEKRKKAEKVGEEAAKNLMKSYNAKVCADEYLTDQLIQLMALADGTSKLRTGTISLHTKTAIHFSQIMTGAKFTIQKQGKQNIIICDGIGYTNRFLENEI